MPVTMVEIDALRGEANEGLERARAARREAAKLDIPEGYTTLALDDAECSLAAARFSVEAALRQWWAQGCREVKLERVSIAIPEDL